MSSTLTWKRSSKHMTKRAAASSPQHSSITSWANSANLHKMSMRI